MAKTQIRLINSHAEFRQCEDLQKTVWGSLSVASEVMLVTQKYGGAVLGAFVDEKLAGFLYAFPGGRNGKMIHWSHMMAVAPGFRDRGLGFRMKLAHRRLALERGIESICWTFDPLQSRNAALNLARLAAQAEEYVVDCYGHFRSKIEKGLPSDRLVVNWQIASAKVARRLQKGPPKPAPLNNSQINETETSAQGFLKNLRLQLDLRDRRLALEIPANTDEIRARDFPLASKWRFEARQAFQSYLARGYKIESFIPPGALGRKNAFYVFRRNS